MTALVARLAGWLLLAALVVCLGSVAGRWIILRPAAAFQGVDARRLRPAAGRYGLIGGVLLMVAMGLVFWRQLMEFRDPFVPWTEDASLLLSGTEWGTTWMVASIGSALTAAAFTAVVLGWGGGWWVAGVGTLAVAAFPAFTGHAAATEGLRALTLTADTLHVWAAGVWLGGLTLLVVLERSWRRAGRVPSDHPSGLPSSLLPGLVAAFSPLAIACVGTLIVTGILAAWVQLPELSALWTATYGRLLVLKVTLALVAFGLGGINWKRLTPRLSEAGGTEAMRRAAAIEILVGHVVILVTAILVRTSPTGH